MLSGSWSPRLLPITLQYVTLEQLLAMCATRWPPACLQLQLYIKLQKNKPGLFFFKYLFCYQRSQTPVTNAEIPANHQS